MKNRETICRSHENCTVQSCVEVVNGLVFIIILAAYSSVIVKNVGNLALN